MNDKKIAIRFSEICYFIFFILLLFAKGIGWYDGQLQFKIILVIAVLFLGIKMSLTRYSFKEVAIIILLILIGSFSYYKSGEKGLLLYCLLIVGMKNVSINRVFKIGLVTWCLAFGGTLIYYLFHLSDSVYKVHAKLGLGHMFRYGLGYAHPNILHLSYLVLVFFVVYLLRQKYTIGSFVTLMLGNLFVFMYSVSYTGFIIVTFYLLLSIYFNYQKKMTLLEKGMIQLVLPMALFVSIYVPIKVEGSLFLYLDKIFNSRIWLAKYYLTRENYSLWGIRIANIVTPSLTMDNAYVFSLITYGFIFFIGLVLAYIVLIFYHTKKDNRRELAIILATIIMGITEAFMFNTSFKNVSFLIMGATLFSVENRKENITLLSNRDIVFHLKYSRIIMGVEYARKKIKKSILKMAIVTCILGGMISILLIINYDRPASVIVPRVNCEDIGDETLYLTEHYQEQYPHSLVIDYKDEETRMQEFQGNIITIELVRKCVSSFVLSAGFVYLICMLYYAKRGSE